MCKHQEEVYKDLTEVGFLYKEIKKNYVVYLRVSTDRQGRSGLGIDAQRASVADYVKRNGNCEVIAEFVEVESGKKSDRPKLSMAISEATRKGAVLLIAKLDRVSRSVSFIANLLDSKIEVESVDIPSGGKFMWHVMSAFAEHEAVMISERTSAALKAAKARGVALGWANPLRKKEQILAAQKGAEQNVLKADQHALNTLPIIHALSQQGLSLRQIAFELNARDIKTARGGAWYASTVRNVLIRDVSLHTLATDPMIKGRKPKHSKPSRRLINLS